jgi:hypothetical protein
VTAGAARWCTIDVQLIADAFFVAANRGRAGVRRSVLFFAWPDSCGFEGMNSRALLMLTIVFCASPGFALGQDSRAEAIADEQTQKATQLTPYKRSRAEELLLTVRQALIEQPSGFYPYFDSVYSGGGFTVGGGYRQFVGDRTNVALAGLVSAKGYNWVELSATSPGHMSGSIDLRGGVGWRDATQVAYHGLGIGSPADVNTAYRMQQVYVRGDMTVRPHRWTPLTASIAYEDYTLKNPTGGYTPVFDVFTPATAPGIGENPTYVHTTASAAFDWRPAADYARRGGLYRISHHHYADQDDVYTFDRLDGEVVQHIPILRETWVISLRGQLQTTLGDDDQVPYFLLPSLGSGSTLRAYSSWRFRDRHAMLMSGEWRWIANRMAVDMAVFFDTGMVAPRLDEIAFDSFVSNWGVGIRFHSPVRTPLRVDFAKGSEGMNIVFSASAAF